MFCNLVLSMLLDGRDAEAREEFWQELLAPVEAGARAADTKLVHMLTG